VQRDRFHPRGLIVRKRRDGVNRFARIDATGREIALGSDWQVAYKEWLEARIATTVVPSPLPVGWLVNEFGERHRPADERVCRVFRDEILRLGRLMQVIGNPLIDEFSAADCELM
jgi:hypothetical protein